MSSKFRNPPLLFGKNNTLFVKACRVILRDRAARLETARPRRRFWNCAPTWMVWSVSGTTTSGWAGENAPHSSLQTTSRSLSTTRVAVQKRLLAGSSVRWRFCASPSRRRRPRHGPENRHGTGVALSVENTVGTGRSLTWNGGLLKTSPKKPDTYVFVFCMCSSCLQMPLIQDSPLRS